MYFTTHECHLSDFSTLVSDICQWAILAMRNVLENNQENQQVVAALNRQGLADNSRLQQFGVQLSETDDGKIKVKSGKS